MALLRVSTACARVVCLLSSGPRPATSPEKYTPALDVTAMDRSIDPCVDFFAYSCGGWIKNNPIPPDQSSWDTYSKMQDENLTRLRGILEAAAAPDPNRNAVDQKIGDYYASCTDEKAIEANGATPLKPTLRPNCQNQFQGRDRRRGRRRWSTDNVLFRFDSIQDFRDANQVIANADQGGLGLPDRDYYLKTDAKSVELRKAYRRARAEDVRTARRQARDRRRRSTNRACASKPRWPRAR